MTERDKDLKVVHFTGDGELMTVTWNPFWKVPPIPSTMMKNKAYPRPCEWNHKSQISPASRLFRMNHGMKWSHNPPRNLTFLKTPCKSLPFRFTSL